MSELGNKLRDARIQKGYTLNTLQQMTKIQKKYLVAIEEGNFDEMPGNFYARAFVKQYADMVGLNGDELLETYQQELDVHPKETDYIELDEPEELPSRSSNRSSGGEQNTLEVILSYLPLILLIAIIVMIMISLVIAITNIGQGEDQTSSSQTSIENSVVSSVEPDSVVVETSEPESISEVSSMQELGENDIRVGREVITLIDTEGAGPVYALHSGFSNYEFSIEASGYVWVGIFEDGVLVVDTTISADETFEHTVSSGVETLRMDMGYPEGGVFKVNGVEMDMTDFYGDTISFVLADDVNVEDETMELDINTSDESVTEETTADFQGPAVLDPAFNSDAE
ncbi:helix-turn-helix domain-containing protein [Fundicoccus culcitae]|uniref:Helix-turn-helix domain-containing protein n=1 Tax=Fundicoccus culcitae TaxID=2969821 RepID=A0ABY5P749_9LACT|nr:helix-turn-helix domain-containing protein [Fundicoccus culcitae]UUX34568.1 helix-turn-helix domain-containing protein [Fundicoccus culcitae]